MRGEEAAWADAKFGRLFSGLKTLPGVVIRGDSQRLWCP